MDYFAWYGLRLLSFPYAMAIALRNRCYDWNLKKSFRSPLRVISVGNLSVGGTGKSPTVAWIATWLRQQNRRVAILSRGYGQLEDGRNDEALELELKLPDVPHLQNSDRVASARLAHEELDMEVLVLDDGFQHRRLKRDLDIVLIDATDQPAAQWLLPAGLRRESMSSLRRADFVLVTRADMASPESLASLRKDISKFVAADCQVLAVHRPCSLMQVPGKALSLDLLQGSQVLAFCGIGNSDGFFQSLTSLGAQLVDTRAWPDHHAYTRDDIQWLSQWQAEITEAKLVCTVKDWVKIQESQLGGRDLFALEIDLNLLEDGAERFQKVLQRVLQSPLK